MRLRTVLIASSAAAVAMSLVAMPAGADATLSPMQLAGLIVKKADLHPWWPKAKTVRAPAPGKGANRIPSQGLCFTDEDTISSVKIAKRQAWSDTRMGPVDTQGMISIIGQYKSVSKAKTKMQVISDKLAECPSNIVTAEVTIAQSRVSLGKVYGGKGIGTYTTMDNAASEDSIQYVAIRRTGRAIAFTRYTRMHDWGVVGPPEAVPPKARGAVEFMSVQIAKRYWKAA